MQPELQAKLIIDYANNHNGYLTTRELTNLIGCRITANTNTYRIIGHQRAKLLIVKRLAFTDIWHISK